MSRTSARSASYPSPSYLRLPRAALARKDVVSALVRARADVRARARAEVAHAFAFKDDELSFARTLLERNSCFWLFRTNQRAFAGDFLIVNLSSPIVAKRPAYAVDLKRGAPVRIHDGTGVQLRNAPRVLEEIATTGVVDGGRPPAIVTGDARAVLRFLAARPCAT